MRQITGNLYFSGETVFELSKKVQKREVSLK